VSFGTQTVITGLDLAGFDAMGWRLNCDVMTSLDREFSTRFIPFLSTVPEPSNWAMLIAGFGLTGAAGLQPRHDQAFETVEMRPAPRGAERFCHGRFHHAPTTARLNALTFRSKTGADESRGTNPGRSELPRRSGLWGTAIQP
jgi:hypothetical protein